ncbi:hypothetical protein HYU14_03580 [Candidatus Woesearchaeota archaeon]|nr:hypothetical protein [Candidatus Woesearchaeota archaeon]
MKHNPPVIALLLILFVASQVIGLLIIAEYIDSDKTREEGKAVFQPLPFNLERPPVEEKTSYIYIISAVLAGTALVLLLIRFRTVAVWKLWYFLAVTVTIAIAFSAFMKPSIALPLSILLALGKIFRPNIFLQNISELFSYGGLAAIFVPIMNIAAAAILLVLISAYDYIAVNKLKHMVTMAKFQAKEKLFAGIMLNYRAKSPKNKAGSKHLIPAKGKSRAAILGGGDIGFPLLFSGVVLKSMLPFSPLSISLAKVMIITLCAAFALMFLFTKGKQGKYYPAMPVISLGCFAGYGIIALIGFLARV